MPWYGSLYAATCKLAKIDMPWHTYIVHHKIMQLHTYNPTCFLIIYNDLNMIIRIHSYTKYTLIPLSRFLNIIQLRHVYINIYIYIGKTWNLPFTQRNLDHRIVDGFLKLFTTWSQIDLDHEQYLYLITNSTQICCHIPITKRKRTTTPQPKCLFNVLWDT